MKVHDAPSPVSLLCVCFANRPSSTILPSLPSLTPLPSSHYLPFAPLPSVTSFLRFIHVLPSFTSHPPFRPSFLNYSTILILCKEDGEGIEGREGEGGGGGRGGGGGAEGGVEVDGQASVQTKDAETGEKENHFPASPSTAASATGKITDPHSFPGEDHS
jgi:hypothetical protein